MDAVMSFLNTDAGVGLIHAIGVFAAGWVISKVIAKKPEWEKYRGTLAWAVKQAEEMIPDDTPNKNYARFDTALKIAVDALEGRKVNVSQALIDSFRAYGIDAVHKELEERGKLPAPASTEMAPVDGPELDS